MSRRGPRDCATPTSRRRCRSRVPTTPHGFGAADEDGLRMLAALETLTSLEPDYSDDITSEASVTIIESAGFDAVADALAGEAAAGAPCGRF